MTGIAPSPTSAAGAVLERIQTARASRSPLRIRGAGSWLAAGRPVSAGNLLPLDDARGIVEYVPGDLTMTVKAATSLAEIAEVTRAERQWLALDPAGDDRGTIGATVATNSAGALGHAFGAPRDQVLGLEFVSGAGTVVRGGGRVVKNVAGFDLTRLLVGSWGTLGVITEVSLRLRALPETETTVALGMPPDPAAFAAMMSRVGEARMAAFAFELVNLPLARKMGLGDRPLLLTRLGGNADLVKAQIATLASCGEVRSDVDAGVWQVLRGCDTDCPIVFRLSQKRSAIGNTWETAVNITGNAGFVHGSLARGVVRVALPGNSSEHSERLRAELDRFRGTVIFERLPDAMWPAFARPTALDPLSVGIKRAFDPDRVLNPGILGETDA